MSSAGSAEPVTPNSTRSVSASGASLDFEAVYAQHFEFVWRAVRGLGIPPASVDDVTQDVFIIVHRQLTTLELATALRSWLFSIVRRVCKDHRRSAARKGPHLPLDEQPELDGGTDPQRQAASRQELMVVERFAGCLDEERRALFFLVLIEGQPIADAAETLGLNVNTAYSRVRVLRQELTAVLDADPSSQRGKDG